MKKYWFQVSALTLWSFTFLVPILVRGTNIVTHTFTEGTLRFWSGQSPYQPSLVADVFQYSPLFCFLYKPLTMLPNSMHALVWGFLNVLVFWAGVSVWFRFSKRTPKPIWIALAFCAIELDISQRYQQMNAMLVGVVLLALYYYGKKKYAVSALLISFMTNLKLIPIVFALLLCWPLRKRYTIPLILFSVLWILIPAFEVGLARDVDLHWLQFQAILNDTMGGHGGRDMLDFASSLKRTGYGVVAANLKILTGVTVVLLAVVSRLAVGRMEKQVSLGLLYSFAMLSLLVLSPRTESPTFVFLAPAYLFMAEELKGVSKGLVFIFGFFISFVFTSVWAPYFTWTHHQHYYSKVFSTYMFWIVVSGVLLGKVVENMIYGFGIGKGTLKMDPSL